MKKLDLLIFAVLLMLCSVGGRAADDVAAAAADDIEHDSSAGDDLDDAETSAAGIEEIEGLNEETAFVPVVFSDEEYQRRLAKLPSVINLPYNSIVRNHIQVYTGRKIKDKAEEILGLSEYYFPMFEEILDRYGLPLEFKYLAVIESALKPTAVSRAGATGLWQFMYHTARLYDVTITTTVDERRDPVIATHAAARHLKDLFAEFNDWTLAMAAYNCGAGNVRKAMRRSGKTSFWDIYYYLPRETRGYVPAFIGASYMMNYYKDHNLTPHKINFSGFFTSDTMMVYQWMHFDQIAALTGIPQQTLRDLNPQYRLSIIPGNEKPYPLRIPSSYVNKYLQVEYSISQYQSDIYNPVKKIAIPVAMERSYYSAVPPAGRSRINHTVRSGETLGTIAELYRVRIADLKTWNRVRGNRIYVGQKLNVYVKANKSTKSVAANAGNNEQLVKSDGYLCYQVKHGDTLWDISQRYKHLGISVEGLKSLNQLDGQVLSSGQVLKIKKI
jgi:membrane-bound lytic murein transglycosylase D